MHGVDQKMRNHPGYWDYCALYLLYLFILTLNPFEFSISFLKDKLSSEMVPFIPSLFKFTILDSLNNIILFIPFGILLYLLYHKTSGEKYRCRYWKVLFAGVFLTLCIETSQLFLLNRTTSFFDILFNSVGTVLGYWLGNSQNRVKDLVVSIHHRCSRFWVRLTAVLVYLTAIVFLWIGPYRMNTLRNWNPDFHLIIGNEGTGDRLWEGDIQWAAVYGKALTPAEVKEIHEAGLDRDEPDIRKKGILVLYRFSEGTGTTIQGYSQLQSPVTLSGDTIHWLPGATGIQIRVGSSPLKTVSPMRELTAVLQKVSQFTVEAWIRTDNLEQGGPARFLSLSADPDRRNFTLAQAGHDIHFRVRTPLTGLNGSRINLVGRSVLTDSRSHHLVATFHHGVERLFIDGIPVRDRIRGDIDYFPAVLNFTPGTLLKWALVLGLMLPLGLLVQNLFHQGRRYYGFLLFVSIVVIIEFGISIVFKQPYGWTLVLVSLLPTAVIVLYRKRFRSYPSIY